MSYGFIYKIDFPNGKHYIGLTTTSLQQRKKEHQKCAKSNKNFILYKALRKHNMEDTFDLTEIDSADTREELCNKESYYIQQYDSYYKNGKGYNMTYGGEGTFGYKYTTEQRQKAGKAQKKRFEDPEERQKASKAGKKQWENQEKRQKQSETVKKRNEDHPEDRIKMLNGKGQNKPFDVFKIDGTFIKTFTYHFEAREYLQNALSIKTHIDIRAVLYREQKTSAGFVFNYNPLQDQVKRQKMSESLKKCYQDNPEAIRIILNRLECKNKPFDVFKKDGTFIKTFTSQLEARKYLREELNIDTTIKIGQVLNRKRKTSAGFLFKYKETEF